MKKRYVYALLFGIPGLSVAGILALLIFGASLGFFWLFVFGDDPWPAYAESILGTVLLIGFMGLWVGTITLGYLVGRRLESTPGWNKSHIFLSMTLTLACVLVLLIQQRGVGNFAPKSDDVLCSEYCSAQGYSGSGLPPKDSGDRRCSCYDDQGHDVLHIPLESIPREAPK